jgi:2'-5' RNA ligase
VDHPPHLTIYAGAFAEEQRLEREFCSLRQEISKVSIHIDGWQIFFNDPFTNGHTIATLLNLRSCETLRLIQKIVIGMLAPSRDITASVEIYKLCLNNLSSERQESVKSYGFPFTGADWIPHLTLASVQPTLFQRAMKEIADELPCGFFNLEKLALFSLNESAPPTLIKSFPIHAVS